MKNSAVILALGLVFAFPALAAQTEGRIASVDRDALTITLDDGESFKLPGEIDLDALQEGMDVVLAYDEVKGEKLITDMQIDE